MTIPLATTTIRILRVPPDPERDPTDVAPAEVEVASGVRAHISTNSGSEQVSAGASQERIYFRLAADPCDLDNEDAVVDLRTGERYQVEWVRQRQERPGLEHTQAGLRQITGVVSGTR